MLQKFVKCISTVLVFVLLFNMVPVQVFGQSQSDELGLVEGTAPMETVPAISMENNTKDIVIVAEIPSERTEYSKEFLLSNGLHMMTMYAEPVHYEKDGAWEEINNTLKSVKNGTYQNTAGVWDVSFPAQFGEKQQVTIQKDGYTLSFGIPQKLTNGNLSIMSTQAEAMMISKAETATAEVMAQQDVSLAKAEAEYPETVLEGLASRMTYGNIYSDMDVIYDLQSNKLKESVVLEAYDKKLQGVRYTLQMGAMIPVLQEDGSILLYGEDGKTVVMAMPAPYLMDDAMEICTDISVSLTGKDGQYALTYILPQDWMGDEQRQWPVILDPVIQADLEVTNVRDASVAENTTFSYTSPVLETGYYQGEGKQRTYLKYRTLPSLTSADVVVNATMTLYKFTTNSTSAPIEVHKVLGDWESESITWANKPDYDESIVDFVICQEARYYHWDVTDIVQEWYKTGNNYGMLFKASDAVENSGANNFKQFYSSDYSSYPTYMPTLQVSFRNNNGLESYWNYTSSSAGRAGTGYVNDYTGNLVWIRSDMGFGGNRMPVAISHVYNANDTADNPFGMGYGWRTNYNQRIDRWTENTAYYVWQDSDGTSHYFEYKSAESAYVDEDGLELKLTVNGSGNAKYTLTDKTGNKSYFDESGRLTKLENNQATPSTNLITYEGTEDLISTITDGAGRVYRFTYTDGYLTRISYEGSDGNECFYATYAYTDGNLTRVTDRDGEYTEYGYESGHMLTSATDIDGYRLEYTYSVETGLYAPCRVTSIREYHNDVAGGHMTIAYSHNQTVFTDVVNGTTLISQFNNFGNTVSVQDDEGRAQYAVYADPESAGKGNQLTLSSKMQNTVVNLLSDSSFENGTVWSGASAGNASFGYLGDHSLRSDSSYLQSEGICAKSGKTYTFSGYVKTESGTVELGITNGQRIEGIEGITAGDWTRFEVSYTNNSGTDQTIYAVFSADEGVSYIDCVQLEEMPTASRYNLVQNGDMNSVAYWTATGLGSNDTVFLASAASPVLSRNAYQITGDFTSYKSVKQTIAVSGGEGDSFVFGGWAMGNSATLTQLGDEQAKDFALKCTIYHGTTVVKEEKVQFNPDVDNWQFVSGAIAATGAYTSITIELIYSKNANTVYFDGIQLFKEEFGVSYTYDEDGNVISTVDLQQKNTTYEYDEDNNLTGIIQDGETKMEYTYDDFHNVLTATTEIGLCYTFTYDAYGNNTAVSITEGGKTISSSATYTENGNYLAASTDAMGNTTTYSYNAATGVLEWVQLPEDTEETRTEYTYDEMYRVASIAADTETNLRLTADYTYEDDLLASIETPTATYSFEYGNFSLREKVLVGGRTLATYTYEEQTNRLIALDYGNQGRVQYAYDDYGRLTLETYEDGQTVSYAYDNSGNLATVTDSETGCVTTYYYDLLNRLVGYREKSATLDHSVIYTYDDQNNLSSMAETIGGATKTYSYTYDEDNRLISMSVGDATVSYTYDDFGRVSNRTTKHGETVIESITPQYYQTETTTSGQIVSYNDYSYTYDQNGNITYYGDGRISEYYFQYDSQNQLIRAESYELGYIWIWEYDNAGNILSRTIYDFFDTGLETPLETVEYQYTDSEWGDLLTSYNGRTITYDAIGNPLNDGRWTYTWQHGRQLATMSNEDTTWNFTYNADGMRTSRTDGTTTYTYVYNGSQLTQMTVDGQNYEFTYDATGIPLTVTVDGSVYYYSTNLQGDVVSIQNQNGHCVAAYTYDPWGNVTCNHIWPDVIHNPLLYRGYVYDSETELYYLQSRYYNPEWGRFINADGLVATGQGFVGNNMFAYCNNNPVCMLDSLGQDAIYVANYDQNQGGLIIVGHAQLYVQDTNGTWYVVEYTGSTPENAKVYVYSADMDKVKKMKGGRKIDKLEYVYLKGDYSKSLQEARKYNSTSYGGYCLVTNNCLHFVRNMLRKSNVKTSFVQNVILENDTIIPADFYQALATADALNKIYSYVLYYAYFSNRYKEYPYHHPRR